MKKIVLILGGLIYFASSNAQTITAGITSNGIQPIPSFSLNKPAILTSGCLNVTKHIEYDPDCAIALIDGKGWYTDQWVRWNQNLDTSGKWVLTGGLDWQLFCQPLSVGTDNVTQTVHYPTIEAKIKFSPTSKNSFVIDYWYTSAIETKYGIKGHYAGASYVRTQEIKKIIFMGTATCYYLNSTDGSVGLIGWIDANISHKKSGMFLDIQAINPISATAVPFNWCITLGVTRKVF